MEGQNLYAAPQAEIRRDQPLQPWEGMGQMASRMQRLGAAFIDFLILLVIYIPLLFAMVVIDEAGGGGETMALIGMGVFLVGALALAGINLYLLYKNGQTIGKKLLGIKIVRSDMVSRASLMRILFLRIFPVWLIGNFPCVGSLAIFGNYVAIFSAEQRCGHDYIADTHVVIDDGTVGTEEYLSGGYTGYLESSDPMPRRDVPGPGDSWEKTPADNWNTPPAEDNWNTPPADKWNTPAAEKGWDPGSSEESWDPGGVEESWDPGDFDDDGDQDWEDSSDDEWDYSTDKGF